MSRLARFAMRRCVRSPTRPDTHFLIDFHPSFPNVLISSACSGHGFKFASAIGELQADLLIDGRSRFDLCAVSACAVSAR